MSERLMVPVAGRCPPAHRGLEVPLQRRSASYGPGRLDASNLRQPSWHSPSTCIRRGPQTGSTPCRQCANFKPGPPNGAKPGLEGKFRMKRSPEMQLYKKNLVAITIIALFFAAFVVVLLCDTSSQAATSGRFEIVIQATRQQKSQTFIQGKVDPYETQYPWQAILTIRGNNIYYQEILQNQGQSRKDQGVAYDINGTVNCISSRLNPFDGSKYTKFSEKNSRTNVTGRSCSATSQLTANFISLYYKSSNSAVTQTREYTFESTNNIDTTARISYDYNSGTCSVDQIGSVMDSTATGLSGNFLNNTQHVTFDVVRSSCSLKRL